MQLYFTPKGGCSSSGIALGYRTLQTMPCVQSRMLPSHCPLDVIRDASLQYTWLSCTHFITIGSRYLTSDECLDTGDGVNAPFVQLTCQVVHDAATLIFFATSLTVLYSSIPNMPASTARRKPKALKIACLRRYGTAVMTLQPPRHQICLAE